MKCGVFVPNNNEDHSRVLRAFADGVKASGDEVFVNPVEQYQDCDVAVVFGVLKYAVPYSAYRGSIIERQKREGKPVIVIDTGYLRRDRHYMVGLGGLNGRADFKNENSPSDRWDKLGLELKPYRETGKHVLVCSQIPWDASVQDHKHPEWMQWITETLPKYTDRPIIYRPHPKITPYQMPPIEEVLRDCWCLITFSGNSAVDALIAGIPAISCDEGSMAWPICDKSITVVASPSKPWREPWVHNLAYCQWNEEEMKEGLPWKHLIRR